MIEMIEHIDIEGSVKWKQKSIGKRQYEITHPDEYLTGAGAGTPVTAILKIREWHRLIKVEVKHADASNDDNTDAITWFIEKSFFKCTSGFKLRKYTGSVKTDFLEAFGEKYEYPQEEYTISIDTTVNHRIYVKIFVQKTR